MTRHRYSRSEAATTWAAVGVLIAGALLVAAGVVIGSRPLAISGVVVVLVCLTWAAIMRRRGSSGPISFGEEFPENTVGPRATAEGGSAPPIDTDPSVSGGRRS